MHFAKHSAANALIDGWKSVELCQAYILMSIYAVPARRWEEDRSWLYTGLAIRYVSSVHLPSVLIPLAVLQQISTFIMYPPLSPSMRRTNARHSIVRGSGWFASTWTVQRLPNLENLRLSRKTSGYIFASLPMEDWNFDLASSEMRGTGTRNHCTMFRYVFHAYSWSLQTLWTSFSMTFTSALTQHFFK